MQFFFCTDVFFSFFSHTKSAPHHFNYRSIYVADELNVINFIRRLRNVFAIHINRKEQEMKRLQSNSTSLDAGT